MYRNNQTGFTLIELLVVISIIGLMSSTVLAAVNNARERAQSTANNEIMSQYRLAIELAADAASGTYPIGSDTNQHCLGDHVGDRCGYTDSWGTGLDTEDPLLSNLIKPYIPGLPVFSAVYVGEICWGCGNTSFKGPVYGCLFEGNPPVCRNKRIMLWFQKGLNQSCGIGSGFNLGEGTFCSYRFE